MQQSSGNDEKITKLRIPEAAGIADPEKANAQASQFPAATNNVIAVKAFLPPKELYEQIAQAGVMRSHWRLDRQILMGLCAAFYIGLGFTLTMLVGGQVSGWQTDGPQNPFAGLLNFLMGAVGFPMGLFMVVALGADLFTSDCSFMTVALSEHRVKAWHVFKCLVLCWWTNLVGSIIMALIVYWAWIFHGRENFTYSLIVKKTSLPFGVCLCKGIIANWLVNLAVWLGNSAQDLTGKAIGVYLPVSAFITMGGEHCIANQFLFALGKLMGVQVSVKTMILKNLIPATIGNIIGGVFFMGVVYSCSVGSLFDQIYTLLGKAMQRCPVLNPRGHDHHDLSQLPHHEHDDDGICMPIHHLLQLVVPHHSACPACTPPESTGKSMGGASSSMMKSGKGMYQGEILAQSVPGLLRSKESTSTSSSSSEIPAGMRLDV